MAIYQRMILVLIRQMIMNKTKQGGNKNENEKNSFYS